MEEVFPGTRHQRCWVHKAANVLNKIALAVQVNMKAGGVGVILVVVLILLLLGRL